MGRGCQAVQGGLLESDPPGLEDLRPGNPVTEGQNPRARLPSALRHRDCGITMVCCFKPGSFGAIRYTTVDN